MGVSEPTPCLGECITEPGSGIGAPFDITEGVSEKEGAVMREPVGS